MRVEILLKGNRDRIMIYADTVAQLGTLRSFYNLYLDLSRGQNNLRKLLESKAFKVGITTNKKSPTQLKIYSSHITEINYHS